MFGAERQDADYAKSKEEAKKRWALTVAVMVIRPLVVELMSVIERRPFAVTCRIICASTTNLLSARLPLEKAAEDAEARRPLVLSSRDDE